VTRQIPKLYFLGTVSAAALSRWVQRISHDVARSKRLRRIGSRRPTRTILADMHAGGFEGLPTRLTAEAWVSRCRPTDRRPSSASTAFCANFCSPKITDEPFGSTTLTFDSETSVNRAQGVLGLS
jgi:hypothetical protein